MKAWLKIVGVEVLNKEDATTPTKLTVSYRGWWHSPMLHVPLATAPLCDTIHTTPKDGKITLIQQFQETMAPMFRVKGRNSKLVIRLYAGHSLRTRAKVTVGDLVSATAQRLVKVPFEEIKGEKVEKAFLSVLQSSPDKTPPPPPVQPLRYNQIADPWLRYTFSIGDYEPSQARLKYLVQEIYGPWPDPKEWLLPSPPLPSNTSQCIREGDSSLPTLEDDSIENAQCKYDAEEETEAPHQLVYVDLWKQVFGEHSSRGSDDNSNENQPAHQSVDVDASFVHLWNQVFKNYSSPGSEDSDVKEPPRHHEADHDCETAEDCDEDKTVPNTVEEESPCEVTPLGTAEEYDGIKTPLHIEKDEECLVDAYSPIPEQTDDTQHSGEKHSSLNVHSAQGNQVRQRHRRKHDSFKSLESYAQSMRDTHPVRCASLWDYIAQCAAVVTVALIVYNSVLEFNKYY